MSFVGQLSKERLALEAKRLATDDVLNEAYAEVRRDALEALALADADDKTMILRLQMKVKVIEEVQSALQGFILRGGSVTGGPE